MKALQTGELCYIGDLENKEKRIYLGTFGKVNICVAGVIDMNQKDKE
jgi:hypothetical protein